MESPTIVIDCHGIGHASKIAYGGLSYGGMPTAVIYGFLYRVLSFTHMFYTKNFVFAWDSKRSFRKDLYPQYKEKDVEYTEEEQRQHRDAIIQFSKLRTEILPSLGFINIHIQPGLEADDLIASVVMNNHGKYIVASDDKDLYQLLDYCDLYKLRNKKLYTSQDLKKEWEVTPKEWIEVKRLSGCGGDNVPNIPGVREKTAIKYMRGVLKGDKVILISQYISEKKFLNRNSKLTKLPFFKTKKIKVLPQPPLKMLDIMNVCSRYGLNSLMKGKPLKAWQFLCEEVQFDA